MIFIKILLIFLCGFAFCQWICPLLDELQATFLSWLETKKGNMAVQIAEINLKTQEIAKKSSNEKTQAIGFQISEEEEEDEDYEDDE